MLEFDLLIWQNFVKKNKKPKYSSYAKEVHIYERENLLKGRDERDTKPLYHTTEYKLVIIDRVNMRSYCLIAKAMLLKASTHVGHRLNRKDCKGDHILCASLGDTYVSMRLLKVCWSEAYAVNEKGSLKLRLIILSAFI